MFSLKWLTVFVHFRFKTLSETAGSALVAVCLVNWTSSFGVSLCFACVDSASMNGSLKKARAAYVGRKHTNLFRKSLKSRQSTFSFVSFFICNRSILLYNTQTPFLPISICLIVQYTDPFPSYQYLSLIERDSNQLVYSIVSAIRHWITISVGDAVVLLTQLLMLNPNLSKTQSWWWGRGSGRGWAGC